MSKNAAASISKLSQIVLNFWQEQKKEGLVIHVLSIPSTS